MLFYESAIFTPSDIYPVTVIKDTEKYHDRSDWAFYWLFDLIAYKEESVCFITSLKFLIGALKKYVGALMLQKLEIKYKHKHLNRSNTSCISNWFHTPKNSVKVPQIIHGLHQHYLRCVIEPMTQF